MQFMKGVVNPINGLLLRSPLYRLMPGVMLITVTGRHTGRRYTTPVQYARDGDRVYALTRSSRSWWRNARNGAAVELRLRGRGYTGSASACPASDERAAPALAAFHGSSLEGAVRRFGAEATVVAIELDAG